LAGNRKLYSRRLRNWTPTLAYYIRSGTLAPRLHRHLKFVFTVPYLDARKLYSGLWGPAKGKYSDRLDKAGRRILLARARKEKEGQG
jgi:hypothetical protein